MAYYQKPDWFTKNVFNRAVELMTGRKPAPLEPMRAAGHSELARRAALPAR